MASPIPLHPDAAHGLAMAMVAASAAPLLLLTADLTILAASTSFTDGFRLDAGDVRGRKIRDLGKGEWGAPRVVALLCAALAGDGAVDTCEIDLKTGRRAVRHLLLRARRLNYGDGDVCLLLTISDAAAALIERVRDKTVLVQEAQHRIADSMQVIASLLMLSARRLQSDETRHHLFDVHHREMSIATVQKHLALSAVDRVELRPYFTNLCKGLGVSMTLDSNRVLLDVTVDGSVASADVSMALGLIVTELVINASKHAFPNARPGRILVDYRARGAAWALSVSDDGLGLPQNPEGVRSGLGARIIEALALHLKARVNVVDAQPGTTVSIIHGQAPQDAAGPSLRDSRPPPRG